MIFKKRNGFSLIELLVVLAILGILAAVVAPRVLKHVGTAKSGAARLQIQDISAAIDLYYLEVESFPTTEQGLLALVQAPEGVDNWNGPYLKKKKLPKDPWHRDYHYKSPGENGPYDLYTFGLDNKPGGKGENMDILNWE